MYEFLSINILYDSLECPHPRVHAREGARARESARARERRARAREGGREGGRESAREIERERERESVCVYEKIAGPHPGVHTVKLIAVDRLVLGYMKGEQLERVKRAFCFFNKQSTRVFLFFGPDIHRPQQTVANSKYSTVGLYTFLLKSCVCEA